MHSTDTYRCFPQASEALHIHESKDSQQRGNMGVIALIPIFPNEAPDLEWTKDEDHVTCEEVRI